MDVMNFFESIFRWLHVFFGIIWIGMLYFFNWVNGPFEADAGRRDQEEGDPGAAAAGALLVPLGRCVHLGDRRAACCSWSSTTAAPSSTPIAAGASAQSS